MGGDAGGGKSCRCCVCCYRQNKISGSVSDEERYEKEGEDKYNRPRKHICLRKFLAVTCSQLGLLFVIVLYVVGGCFLFTYLERQPQQTRLNSQIDQVSRFFKEISGIQQRQRRSPGDGEETHSIVMQCVNLQITALQRELTRLNAKMHNYQVRTRLEELVQLKNDVKSLNLLNNQKELEKILKDTLNIDLAEQTKAVEATTSFATNTRQANPPPGALEDFLRSVYDAIQAGWVPPPRQPEVTLHANISKPQGPRGMPPPGGEGETRVFNRRLPQTDPWTLSGSLFFVITVITTIGYGQVVPKTSSGRLATIFYGLFGIPMMLLFLANLGSLMADVFRMAYKNICCCCQRVKKMDTLTAPPAQAPPNPKTSVASPALSLRSVPGRMKPRTSALHQLVKKTAPLPGVSESIFVALAGSDSIFSKAMQARRESRSVRIPVWLVLCIFFLYLTMGALLFSQWEKWRFLEAMYFVFVTISTIGFGDIIPGNNDTNTVLRMEKFIFCIVYLVFGLAIVAMCFDLMQLEVKRKSKRLAKRIGLISSL